MRRRELERTVESQDQLPGCVMWLEAMVKKGLAAGPVAVRLGRERRTLDQNAKLWPMLTDISRQVEWVKDGERCHMPPEEWKDLFTASLRKQSMAPGIDGGMVIIGLHTSTMSKRRFVDLIDLMYAFGNERDVRWSEKSRETINEYVDQEDAA